MAETPHVIRMAAPSPREIRFEYTYDQDYRIVAANGAYGGVSAYQAISVDFYVERIVVPDAIVQRVGEGGVLSPEERVPDDSQVRRIERRMQTGVLLTPEVARVIGQWLIEKADEADKMRFGVPEQAGENAEDQGSK